MIAGEQKKEVKQSQFTVSLPSLVHQSVQSVTSPTYPSIHNSLTNSSWRCHNATNHLAMDLLGHINRRRLCPNPGHTLPPRNLPAENPRRQSQEATKNNRKHRLAHEMAESKSYLCGCFEEESCSAICYVGHSAYNSGFGII